MKPCPVCGNDGASEPLDIVEDAHLWRRVECGRCRVHGPEASTEQGAVDAWNMLHDEAARRTREAIAAAIRDVQVVPVAPELASVIARLEALERRAEREDSYRQEQSER
jgi:hypothetical protein